ncbi:hypothetical protein EBB07_16060 [Paenibacillaceae bacterium]|nr:hypothetical protein EBB07_16060 [Paenibacillaceae bacterium]
MYTARSKTRSKLGRKKTGARRRILKRSTPKRTKAVRPGRKKSGKPLLRKRTSRGAKRTGRRSGLVRRKRRRILAPVTTLPIPGSYTEGFDSSYTDGYNAGFAKGFEDGHQLAYEQQS